MSDLSQAEQDKLDAAVFRRLLKHLDDNKQVQNIEKSRRKIKRLGIYLTSKTYIIDVVLEYLL